MQQSLSATELEPLVRRALDEDIGSGDVTTSATVPAGTRARARITQKQPGVLFGLDAAQLAFALLDRDARFARLAAEGTWRDGGPVLEASGGIDLQTIPGVAETGVQFISVGALTHSAPSLDLSLLLEPLP